MESCTSTRPRVHSEGIYVATLDQSFGHSNILLLHALMLQSQVIHDPIDLAWVSRRIISWWITVYQQSNSRQSIIRYKNTQQNLMKDIWKILHHPGTIVDLPGIKVINQVSIVMKVWQVICAGTSVFDPLSILTIDSSIVLRIGYPGIADPKVVIRLFSRRRIKEHPFILTQPARFNHSKLKGEQKSTALQC